MTEKYKKTTVTLPDYLHTLARIYAIWSGKGDRTTLSDVVVGALEAKLCGIENF